MQEQIFNSDSNSRLKWYLEVKFGLFIHWGPYTVEGAEASWPIMAPRLSEAMFKTPSNISEENYVNLPQKFNPIDFDADNWVQIACNAGMKYIVITSKHHDGFCMFDAPGTDYKIINTPFGRDVCMELAQACKRADMKLGFYYSPPDMHHPGYRDTSKPALKNWLGEPKRKEWTLYLDYMESHIRKLLTDYGDVSILWFDGLCNHAKYGTERFHKLIHELSPNTLINDRLGSGYDFVTPEQFIPTEGIPVKTGKPPSGDGIESEKFFRTVINMFKIPGLRSWVKKQMGKYAEGTLDLSPLKQENYPSPDRAQPWETCMTIGHTWAYNPNEQEWKSSKELVRNLVTVAGHGGNFLLNVGPTDRGVFPPEAVERLEYIGKWINRNEDALYSTQYTNINNVDWGTATHKDDRVFLHILNRPESGIILIEDFSQKIIKASLNDGTEIKYKQEKSRVELSIPEETVDKDVTVVTLKLERDKKQLAEYSKPRLSGKPIREYIRSNAIVSAVINGIANGLIALFSYKAVISVPAIDAGVDILITVAIISFLTSWLVIGGTRKDIEKEKVAVPVKPDSSNKKPMNSALKGLLVMLVCTVVFGGFLALFVLLVLPNGFSGWGYILFKTIYTSITGALAVFLSIRIVIREKLWIDNK